MLPAIAKYIVCPFHEALLGRKTFAFSKELEWSQWCCPDDIHELQRRKLGELLHHSYANVPFYRKRFEEACIELDSADPFEVLGALPTLSKDDIRQNVDDMLWRQAPGGLFEFNTGGSTGEPLTFYFDRRRQGYDQAARIRTHRWFGVDVGERELYLWGSPIELSRTDRIKQLRDGLFNHHLLSAFSMSPERMDAYIRQIERYNPACLFGYPSSLALLVEHARANNIRFRAASLKAVFVTGEVCYPHHRELLEDQFGVPVADCYGSREGGFIAHQCEEGEFHITAENVIVEILDDGEPVEQGGEGEIVITHLDAYGMPFIRYATGDMGRHKSGRCACGRGLPMMEVISGRATDFLYLPDGTIKHALSIIYPLRELGGIRHFRVLQDEDFSVTVAVEQDRTKTRIDAHTIEQRVREVVGESVSLKIEFVDKIPLTESGKYRYVISRASAPGEVREEELALV